MARKMRLGIDFDLRENLLSSRLEAIHALLRQHAPTWSSDLHIFVDSRTPKKRIAFRRGELTKLAAERVSEKGPLYHMLGGNPRTIVGSVELRGADPSLIVVLHIDERAVRRLGDSWHWGNTIAIQVCATRVEGKPAHVWARRVFESIARGVSPEYGMAHSTEEYEEKNMIRERGHVEAIGRDISRYLPGLYWVNFFGAAYCALLGEKALTSAPGYEVKHLDAGVLLALGKRPDEWRSSEYRKLEQRVQEHLGGEFFFSRKAPNRKTRGLDVERFIATGM